MLVKIREKIQNPTLMYRCTYNILHITNSEVTHIFEEPPADLSQRRRGPRTHRRTPHRRHRRSCGPPCGSDRHSPPPDGANYRRATVADRCEPPAALGRSPPYSWPVRETWKIIKFNQITFF